MEGDDDMSDHQEMGARMELSGDGNVATLIINGVDLSNYVSEVTYHKKAGDLATLEIGFSYLKSVTIRDIVIPSVPPEVEAALKNEKADC